MLLTVAVSSRDVNTFAPLDILFLDVSFSCLIWTLLHFASVQTRKDCFGLGTLWLECSLTETLSTKLPCQRALKWLTSLWNSVLVFYVCAALLSFFFFICVLYKFTFKKNNDWIWLIQTKWTECQDIITFMGFEVLPTISRLETVQSNIFWHLY